MSQIREDPGQRQGQQDGDPEDRQVPQHVEIGGVENPVFGQTDSYIQIRGQIFLEAQLLEGINASYAIRTLPFKQPFFSLARYGSQRNPGWRAYR